MIEIVNKDNNEINMNYVVEKNDTSITQILKSKYHFSANYIKTLKNNNPILLNSNNATINQPIKHGDCITVVLYANEESENIVPLKMDLEILYEDEFMLIVSKPSNMPIHPSINHYYDSLSNAVKNYYMEHGYNYKIRPVNRLDKDTSGIVIFAKFPFIQEQLAMQMRSNQFVKRYIAFVSGIFEPQSGTINLPIVRKNNSIIERTIDTTQTDSKFQATTLYNTIEYYPQNYYSQVEFQLLTGRTHQIRVHSSYMGHPLLGDTLYGAPSDLISRQALHSYSIEFTHPITNQKLQIISPLPNDMQYLIQKNPKC